ncbi:MAG: AMIN domain-containing protein, partial [Thermodesulfobacteriota bacterium]
MNKIKKLSLFFCSGLLFFFFGFGENGFSLPAKGKIAIPTARLIQLEDQALPDKLRVLIKTSQPVSHHSFTMTNPHRLVIDLSPCVLGKDQSFKIKDPSVERWRFSQFNKKTVRIVLEFTRLPVYHISFQKEKTYSLFVDFPRINPPMTQAVLKLPEQGYLPEMIIENFKKEKYNQELHKN